MYALAQILNHLLLDVITFINEKSKELCTYVITLHVLKIDRVHGYWFCKRLLVLIETVPFTRVTMTTLLLWLISDLNIVLLPMVEQYIIWLVHLRLLMKHSTRLHRILKSRKFPQFWKVWQSELESRGTIWTDA